jgi:hypothetical protein
VSWSSPIIKYSPIIKLLLLLFNISFYYY